MALQMCWSRRIAGVTAGTQHSIPTESLSPTGTWQEWWHHTSAWAGPLIFPGLMWVIINAGRCVLCLLTEACLRMVTATLHAPTKAVVQSTSWSHCPIVLKVLCHLIITGAFRNDAPMYPMQELAHRDIAFEDILQEPVAELQALAEQLGLDDQVQRALTSRCPHLDTPDCSFLLPNRHNPLENLKLSRLPSIDGQLIPCNQT